MKEQAKTTGLHSLRISADEWQQAERISGAVPGLRLKPSQVLRWALAEGLRNKQREVVREVKNLRRVS